MDDSSVESLSSDNVISSYEMVTHHDEDLEKKTTGLEILGGHSEEHLKNTLEGMVSIESGHIKSKESFLDEDCILFHGVNYLGRSSVNAPRSEVEALRTIQILRNRQNTPLAETEQSSNKLLEVVLSVPNRADGVVRILDSTGNGELFEFKVYKILFCVRGENNGPERDCFAFTEAHESSGIFQCHVFQCEMPEAVKKVLYSFELAFRSIPKSLSSTMDSKKELEILPQMSAAANTSDDANLYCFNVTLEMRESDGKGAFASVPWDKASSCFKLRKNLEKQLIMTVTQTTNVELTIERCFGLLLAPGRNVQHSDMHLLDIDKINIGPGHVEGLLSTGHSCHTVSGIWDPSHSHFALLNEETQKGTRVFVSVAIDLVVQEIQEPLRLLLETKARIFPSNEKFWYFGKKILQETFFLKLNEIVDSSLSNKHYAIISLESESSRVRRLAKISTPGTPSYSMGNITAGSLTFSSTSRQDEEDDDDTDEPLLSGSGEVLHDCSENVLTDWGEVLKKWRIDFSNRPSGLKQLVRKGVPNALRGEVWQLLAGCHDNIEILERYRVLISKDSPQESIILRDINRTFPAHDFFKQAGGTGQESLYKICKAYSIHDVEVGYCQGLSFLAAALLLHMPEEQAFAVLCKIMQEYKMRELFKNGFETLRVKFYQLERAIEDLMPDLFDHFKQLSIEPHMYSSQWFLTLFTAKFPLSMVYRVIDFFLCEGEHVIFKVALSLLKCCRRNLLTLDFEGILKYFRVSLPKKYRLEENTTLLMETAVNVKVTSRILKKYNKEYNSLQQELRQEDPFTIIERDNRHLMEANMRLESENDDLAEEIITMKITVETQLDKTMKHVGTLQHDLTLAVEELRSMRENVKELTEENQRLIEETKQAKELCRKELERQDDEISKKTNIISDYKTITSQLSLRIEKLQNEYKREIENCKIKKNEVETSDVEKSVEDEREILKRQIRNLELELAQTKLSKVESECKVQDLEHQLVNSLKDLQASKSTWLHKTFSNFASSKTKDSQNSTPTLHNVHR